MSIVQIAREVNEAPDTIEMDLQHLFRSLKHGSFGVRIDPSVCRKCGFQFGPEKLRKPSKCPECKGTWLSEPKISIHSKE